MCKKTFAAAVLAILAVSSHAAERGAVYAGPEAGSTKVDSFQERKASFGGVLGYSFHENFAVEAGYRRLGSWDVTGYNVKIDQAVVSIIGAWPIGKQFSLFSRLGYNRLRAKASSADSTGSGSTSGAMYGVGASFDFAQNASARIEMQKPASDTTNVSLGVLVRF